MNRLVSICLEATIVSMILEACSGWQPPTSAASTSVHINSRKDYSVIYSFSDKEDGQVPKAGLINMHEKLYGTTFAGGRYGDGTVFRISTAGKEKIIYSFKGAASNDGANPSAGLLAMNGSFYGTTEYGGIPSSAGCDAGTIFRISADGLEKVLYRFYGYTCHDQIYDDGANPTARLIDLNDVLYGTTYAGGSAENSGTFFSASTSGMEKVLYSFGQYMYGAEPVGTLVKLDGTFYGTTFLGGAYSTDQGCCGTVFSMSPTGRETVLYDFVAEPYGSNGAYPEAGLIHHGGTLYGTTGYSGPNGGGTAFSITRSGNLTTLHSFGAGTDGSHPCAALLDVGGMLYGTTAAGGTYGKGTVFSMTLDGKEKILHDFGYGSDGATPVADLIDVKGTLYGTTSAGGTQGYGTVFAIKPQWPLENRPPVATSKPAKSYRLAQKEV